MVAERQTAGRGRQRAALAVARPRRARRQRAAAPGRGRAGPGLAAVPTAGYGWLPLLAGVALVEAVPGWPRSTRALKWPNDLLVGGGQVRRHPGRGGAGRAAPRPRSCSASA